MSKLNNTDLDTIVRNFIYNHGLSPHHIESMNTFCKSGIGEILTNIFRIEKVVAMQRSETELDRSIAYVKFEVHFSRVNLTRPTTDNKTVMMPADARKKDKSYMSWLIADVLIRATAFLHSGEQMVQEKKIDEFAISEIPVMTGSILCNTYGMSKTTLEEIGEDPSDPQGIFIIGGSEWIINNLVSRKYNLWYVFNNNYGRERARAEFISIPGDSFENSSEIKIIYYNSGEISIILTSDRYFKEVEIPFFMVLKLFGMTTEKSIIETIAPIRSNANENEERIDAGMREILRYACIIKYNHMPENARFLNDHGQLVEMLIHEIAIKYVDTKGHTSLEERQKHILIEEKILKEVIMDNFDVNVLPHQGRTAENRFIKALYICIGIRKMLECYFGIIPSTNKDSNEVKRVLPAGDNYSRMIKKEFNKSIVNMIRPLFEQMAATTSFDSYDLESLIKGACKASALKSKLIGNLNQGMSEKIVDGETRKNRMPAEGLKRKNHANVVNGTTIQRSSHTSQIQNNAAAIKKRDIKSSSLNNTCIFQTAEGANAGLIQNTCMGCVISMSSSTEIMYNVIKDDPKFIPYDKIFGINNDFTKIYVNGRFIGYIEDPYELYEVFVARRRGWDYRKIEKINQDVMERKMTICWNNEYKEMDFRTDRGRSLTPFIVVYNNLTKIGQKILGTKADPLTGKGFEQCVLFTKEHADKLRRNQITSDDLFKEGIIDYISPEELKQILCAETIEMLETNKNNFYLLYTHLMIPCTLISITTALTPFLHNCPPTRISFAGNHLRQSCSPYAINFNQRFDKQGYYQPNVHFPLAYTHANLYVLPMSRNEKFFVIVFGALGLEDSLIGNKCAFERGAYYTSKFTYVKKTLENGEIFGIPEQDTTEDIDNSADYSKLNDKGFVPIGTRIKKNDVLIGCLYQHPSIKMGNISFKDVSVIYEDKEDAYVVGIEQGIDGDMNTFIKVRIEIPRQMGVGQKMSSRNGQKGMIAASICQSDLPFTARGDIPVLCINPGAFPSRLTVNQFNEGRVNLLAVLKGLTYDTSFMVNVDDEEISEELVKRGYERNGCQVVYNPRTGVAMNVNIFVAPFSQGRLHKFSEEGEYAVGDTSVRSYVTRQPVGGRKRGGGIRLGEMEKDCYYSNGATRSGTNKMRVDCDGISIYICRNCRNRATVINNQSKTAICNYCGPNAAVFELPTRFASHLVLSLFESMGVRIKFIPRPYSIIN